MADDKKAREAEELRDALLKHGEAAHMDKPEAPPRKVEVPTTPIRMSPGKVVGAREAEKRPQIPKKSIFKFYWLCFKVLGRSVYEDGLRDFMIAAALAICTGIGGFLLGDHDWKKGFVIALSGLILWLCVLAWIHFALAAPSIHLNPEIAKRAREDSLKVGIGGAAIISLALLIPIGLAGWWYSGHSIETEPKTSLRRRTKAIANDLQHYLEERAKQHPPYANSDSRDPNPSEEQKKKIAVSQQYDGETWNYYRDSFMEPMVSITKEYQSKGIETRFLENGLTQHIPWFGMPGTTSVADIECMQDICKFRELAYHVDAKDARIDIP